jgi:tetratricopeptide (TPR) repeat protein
MADINQAVDLHTQAALLTREEHTEKSMRLCDLGNSHFCRFQCGGNPMDLDQAIAAMTRALSSAPDGDPQRVGILKSLGSFHKTRFEKRGNLTDIDQAIEYYQQTMPSTSHDTRIERLGNIAELDTAIADEEQALSLTPGGYPEKPMLLNNLINWHNSRFELLGNTTDLATAIRYEEQAASLAPDEHPENSMLLDRLGSPYQSLFGRLGCIADLNTAISYKMKALSTSCGGADHADSPDPKEDRLSMSLPSAEEDLENLRQMFSRISSISVPQIPPQSIKTLLDFPYPGQSETTVVILCLQGHGFDALTLIPDLVTVTRVPLTPFSCQVVIEAWASLRATLNLETASASSNRQPVFDWNDTENQFHALLAMLWNGVVKPVLYHLGYLVSYAVKLVLIISHNIF